MTRRELPGPRWIALCAWLAMATATAETTARLTLDAAYVDNPFFDPQGLPRPYAGHLRLGVRPSLDGRWAVAADDTLLGRFDAAWERYPDDAPTQAWDVRLGGGWRRRLAPRWTLEGRLEGAHYRAEVYPDDRSWFGGGRVEVAATPSPRLRLALHGGAGLRTFPGRETAGGAHQRDGLLRAGASASAGPFADALWAGVDYRLWHVDSNVGALDSDLHDVEGWLDYERGPWSAGLWTFGWHRAFAGQAAPGGRDRRDRGAGAGGRVSFAVLPWLAIGVNGNALWSWSNADLGEFRHTTVGLELRLWQTWRGAPPRPAPVDGAPVRVPGGWRFRHCAAGAARVDLSGGFNQWQRAPMDGPDADGCFSVVVPLPAGRNTYMYVIDGVRWVEPPDAPGHADDGFGRRTGVIYVFEGGEPPYPIPGGAR